MDYVELNVRVTDPELAEILTAELAELPYESFQTEGEVLKAYIPRERLADCMQQTDDLLARYGIATGVISPSSPRTGTPCGNRISRRSMSMDAS